MITIQIFRWQQLFTSSLHLLSSWLWPSLCLWPCLLLSWAPSWIFLSLASSRRLRLWPSGVSGRISFSSRGCRRCRRTRLSSHLRRRPWVHRRWCSSRLSCRLWRAFLWSTFWMDFLRLDERFQLPKFTILILWNQTQNRWLLAR